MLMAAKMFCSTASQGPTVSFATGTALSSAMISAAASSSILMPRRDISRVRRTKTERTQARRPSQSRSPIPRSRSFVLIRGRIRPGGLKRSEQSLAYQEQISGLPRGLAVDLNGVSYDGCREDGDTSTMLDAKAQGYLWAMDSDGTFKSFYTGIEKLMGQAQRQVDAAGGRNIEWYFAEKPVADFMAEKLATTFPQIKVIWQPPMKANTP
jgi:hypothetical protein